MSFLIRAAIDRSRTVLLLLLLMLTAGGIAYLTIPKEAAPDIDIPIFFVSVTYSGISPEDSERLLVRPLERELQPVSGLKELRAQAGEGFALIRLDFEAGYDNRQALADVREKVDLVKGQLPPGTDEPQVMEVDLSLFPVLVATLSGPSPNGHWFVSRATSVIGWKHSLACWRFTSAEIAKTCSKSSRTRW